MIQKIIHYCRFDRNPLPTIAQKCIDSWKNFLPDFEEKIYENKHSEKGAGASHRRRDAGRARPDGRFAGASRYRGGAAGRRCDPREECGRTRRGAGHDRAGG